MNGTGEDSGGGIHIGGNATINTGGGHIVGKNLTISTTIQNGFAAEEKKQQFQAQIEQLRQALRAMKAEIAATESLDADQKDVIEAEINQHLVGLKEVKDQAAGAPIGKEAPADIASKVGGALDRARGMIDKLQGLTGKAGEVAETVGKFAEKYGPLILSARHLFGLP